MPELKTEIRVQTAFRKVYEIGASNATYGQWHLTYVYKYMTLTCYNRRFETL